MSDLTIFAVGLFTTLLLGGGLGYTVLEFYRAGKRIKEDELKERTSGTRIRPPRTRRLSYPPARSETDVTARDIIRIRAAKASGGTEASGLRSYLSLR